MSKYDKEYRERPEVKKKRASYAKQYSRTLNQVISRKEYRHSSGGRYARYKYDAKKRDLLFDLSMEQFMQFWQKPCYYCGSFIETIGLDRVDNTRGYVLDNIQPCCEHCNISKNKFTEDEFIKKCKLVASRF